VAHTVCSVVVRSSTRWARVRSELCAETPDASSATRKKQATSILRAIAPDVRPPRDPFGVLLFFELCDLPKSCAKGRVSFKYKYILVLTGHGVPVCVGCIRAAILTGNAAAANFPARTQSSQEAEAARGTASGWAVILAPSQILDMVCYNDLDIVCKTARGRWSMPQMGVAPLPALGARCNPLAMRSTIHGLATPLSLVVEEEGAQAGIVGNRRLRWPLRRWLACW
jgi:hypothetical protein